MTIDIDRLRELLDKATPGPWMMYGEPEVGLSPSLFHGNIAEFGFGPLEPLTRDDAALIAEGINALPALLDALKAEQAARLAAEAERDDARRARDCFQRTTRAHWEALCAMRNSINEHVPMPNTDSGPLFSPEHGPIYADIATRVVSALASMKGEVDG